MSPPKGTLIFQHLEQSGANAVIGIDTLFLSTREFLKGIKLIPPGLHLFHFSTSVDQGDSIRFGWWFYIEDGQILSIEWNEEQAQFTIEPPSDSVGEMYRFLIEYPENLSLWVSLTKYIDSEALDEYNPLPPEPISTATPLMEENMVLLDLLKRKQPELQLNNHTNQELKYTVVQEKQQRKVLGRELTDCALDRSWYFLELFGHDSDLFLAEMQLCFLHFVVLGNLCSCTQWMVLLRLVLRSELFLRTHLPFCSALITLLHSQFEVLPSEYINELLTMRIEELDKCSDILRNLSFLGEIELLRSSWNELQAVAPNYSSKPLESKFDADNFEVYDLGQYDAEDEDAPAILY